MSQTKALSILHTESSCGWGGQELRILTESAGLLARGHHVRIIAPAESNIYKQAVKRDIPCTALPIARKNLKGLFALRRWLKNNPVDIINSHSSTDSWLAALSNCFLKNPIPLVRTRHVSAPISHNKSTRWLYTKASRFIITTGIRLKQTLVKDNNFPEEMIQSIPTGMSPERFYPADQAIARTQLGLAETGFTLGIMATIRTWKGHLYLIDALHALQRPEISLLVIGDGPARPALEARIAQHQLQNQVTLVGNQEDVTPWLNALDLFILPSYANEGVPQSLMQAMLCELPVISTPIGSTAELVLHEKTGLMIKPKDSHDLLLALQRLIDDETLRATLAKHGRAHVLNAYTLDHMLDSMEQVFYANLKP
jgi:glycosyltransferase involved in cell wall biosynthesis